MFPFKNLFILLAFPGTLYSCNRDKPNGSQIIATIRADTATAKQDTSKKQSYVPPEINEEAMQKAVIDKRDSSFHVYSNIRADYRIIGYESPDTNSRKMVLFSVFTSDVENNPFNCPYGSYYDSAQGDELLIKYIGQRESFLEATIRGAKKPTARVYFQKKWAEFGE